MQKEGPKKGKIRAYQKGKIQGPLLNRPGSEATAAPPAASERRSPAHPWSCRPLRAGVLSCFAAPVSVLGPLFFNFGVILRKNYCKIASWGRCPPRPPTKGAPAPWTPRYPLPDAWVGLRRFGLGGPLSASFLFVCDLTQIKISPNAGARGGWRCHFECHTMPAPRAHQNLAFFFVSSNGPPSNTIILP